MAATAAHGEVCVARQGNGSAPEYGAIGGHLSELRISLGELLFPDAARAPLDLDSGPGDDERATAWPEIRLPEAHVQRAADRKVIRLASGVVWERLTTASIPNVDFLHVTYEVGGASCPDHEFQRHAGQEWGF